MSSLHQYFFCIALLSWFSNNGQSDNIGLTYGPSKFLRHSKKSTFDSPPSSYFLKMHFNHKVSGNKHWHKYWSRPTFGTNVIFFDFGDDKVLGHAWGIFPSIRFDGISLFRSKVIFHFGSGLAYINKKVTIQV